MTFRERSGKLLSKAFKPVFRLWIKPNSVRVRVLVANDKNEILLVRTWIGSQLWSPPGGGIGLGEQPKVAAVREVREETGVNIFVSELKELGLFQSIPPDLVCTLQAYRAQANGTPGVHGLHKLEILEAAWFAINNLPKRRSKLVDQLLEAANL